MEEIQKIIKQKKPFGSREEAASIALQITAERVKADFNDLFKTKDLTGQQYNVLRILRGAGTSGLSCGEVGERMITRDSDITRMLDRLEKRGLIIRERQTDDRRVVLTVITEKGAELLADLDGAVDRLHKDQLGHMSENELDTLIKLLGRARQRA